MKRFIVLFLAMCMVVCFATVSMAALLCDVKTTSEAITASEDSCEKIGSMSFDFDEGTVLQDGDWWYADLPLGVTICRTMNFAILGAAGAVVPGAGGFPVGATAATAADDGASVSMGFCTLTDTVAGDGVNGTLTVAGSAMWFRVSAISGASRILIQVFDSDAAAYTNAACADGTSTLTLGAGTTFSIKILDTDFHAAGPWGYNDTDSPVDGAFGDDGAADVLGVTNAFDNTVCVEAFGYSSSTVNVGINSGGRSGANFLTFNPSNPQVAHLISAASITLEDCKADEYGYVSLTAGQTSTCLFDYDSPTTVADGYCTDVGSANFTGSVVTGNKILIQNNSGTFFDSGDNYQLVLRISGSGAYWGGTTPVVAEYNTGNTNQCNAHASAGNEANVPGGAWGIVTETGVAAGAVATGAGCGSIAAASRYVSLTSAAFTGIDDCYLIEVNTPNIVFDPAQFSEGDQVTVTVELWRLPCGLIFTDQVIVAEFVDTCPTAAATTTLLYPYSTPLNDSSWWFGMSFCNPNLAGAVAGTALITVYEDDGDVGTYTTPAIAVGGMATYGGAELLSNLTAAAANTGTLGDSRCHIIVTCSFGGAGGFGMMGDGSDSTGYAAYGNSAAWAY
jgi:hypothetical protein